MSIRYTDINAASDNANDFVIRKRTPTIPQLIFIFVGALVVTLAVTITVAEADRIAVIAILLIVLGMVGWYVIMQTQRNRDLVMTTEFQNALFASALGINNRFCLIIRQQNGNIVYLDRSFQGMFPDFSRQPRQSIDMLLEYGKIPYDDTKKIFAAIGRNVYDKVVFKIHDSRGKLYKIVMSIEPILRPSGFILLRGREYTSDREISEVAGVPANSDSFSKSSTFALFSYVIDHMDMGVYMTGPTGNIIYANPVLEQWLGFQEGEITSGTLSLQDIARHTSTNAEPIQPDNFEGIIVLQKKGGHTIQGFINQKVIRNEQGKAIGCTGLVNNVTEKRIEARRKLW